MSKQGAMRRMHGLIFCLTSKAAVVRGATFALDWARIVGAGFSISETVLAEQGQMFAMECSTCHR